MPQQQWARLKTEYDCPLRRGAWYEVLSVSPLDAVLEVNHQALRLPLRVLELVSEVPNRWTIVERPRASLRIPTDMSPTYAVCPSCRARVPVGGAPPVIRCRRCSGVFEVDWNRPYKPKQEE